MNEIFNCPWLFCHEKVAKEWKMDIVNAKFTGQLIWSQRIADNNGDLICGFANCYSFSPGHCWRTPLVSGNVSRHEISTKEGENFPSRMSRIHCHKNIILLMRLKTLFHTPQEEAKSGNDPGSRNVKGSLLSRAPGNKNWDRVAEGESVVRNVARCWKLVKNVGMSRMFFFFCCVKQKIEWNVIQIRKNSFLVIDTTMSDVCLRSFVFPCQRNHRRWSLFRKQTGHWLQGSKCVKKTFRRQLSWAT